MANTYTYIDKNIVSGSSTTSVTFSSIPQTYTDLVVKVYTRASDTAGGYNWAGGFLTFNNDSASNYRYQNFWYQATSGNYTDASGGTGTSLEINANNNSYVSDGFCSGDIYISNYKSTNHKNISIETMPAPSPGLTNATLLWFSGNTYTGTSAITSITLAPSPTKYWIAGTSFWLYGIKNT